MMWESFVTLTAVLIVWFSDGSYTVSTHKLVECYDLADSINGVEGADSRLVDSLHFPDDYTTANSALCVDPFTGED